MTRWVGLAAAALVLTGSAAWAAVADGYVVRVDSATIYMDWGASSGVKSGDHFEIYREGEPLKHPVTGEILGKTEETLASGTVQDVDPKFDIGHLDTITSPPRPGDRTRWISLSMTQPVAAAVAAPAAAVASADSPVQELWRSDALEKDAVGITFGDLEGTGTPNIIVAYDRKIVIYRVKDKKLEVVATYNGRSFHRWLTVDVMDLKHNGHPEIFATAFFEGLNRAHVIVLDYDKGHFKQVADIEGFCRLITRLDGTPHLYWQNMSRSRDHGFSDASELAFEKDTYKPGSTLGLKLNSDQLFGYAWGDFYKSGSENFAVLERGERVRIYSKDIKWKSSDVFGGTKNDFSLDENKTGSVYPRLMRWRPADGDRDQLILPTNIPDLGIHMTHLKIYSKSEIDGLQWNGLEMKQLWRIPIAGYLADFGIADVLGQSRPQLWAAIEGGGDKTVLVSYSLP